MNIYAKINGDTCKRIAVYFFSLLALRLENFLTAVITASLAHTVTSNELSALGALGHAGETKLPIIGASLISASF